MSTLSEDAPDAVSEPQETLDAYLANFDEWLEIAEEAGHSTEDAFWTDFYTRSDGEAEPVTEWSQVVRERILDNYYEVN